MAEIESVLHAGEAVPPPPSFAARANLTQEAYEAARALGEGDPQALWAREASRLAWERPWDRVLDWDPPRARWFVGGRLNAAVNCVDRHVREGRGDKRAIVWEGEPGDERVITYRDLAGQVSQAASALSQLGVRAGDRVAIYLPLVPEAVVAMLACARIGAPHTVVFGGFAADALSDRMNDARAKVLVTADGGYRKGAVIPLKANADAALAKSPSVESVLVVRRTGADVPMRAGRDRYWHEALEAAPTRHEASAWDSEHPLFVLYTSGSTGKPKGVLHTTGGYLTHAAASTRWVFDLKDDDVYWCTADVGWVTGHTYLVYGPLANGATVVLYEGAPTTPAPDRWWDIVGRRRVTVLYTAPTAIRTFVRLGEAWPGRHDLSSLRLLGTVGEPINPEAWSWYRRVIGGNRCPVVDTWWQTETGGICIAPVPGAVATPPGSATFPLPGIDAAVVDREGNEVASGQGGFLVIRRPWPGMLRTVFGDDERYVKQYWSQVRGPEGPYYFTGDGARRDEQGRFWILGRVDDVIKVSGHRLGTMEIESALVSHPQVAEAAVVGRPDAVKGEAIVAFVTPRAGVAAGPPLADALRAHVSKELGALARPEEIRFADALPKTRSGKIMRRLLRELAATGAVSGDVTTLEDLSVLASLRADEE
ncbi:MAG TPA: acetate--CoA ligase [Candidatus Thermoplasmatota archaeon]|nr:acetate--CoA ligase [Candidatus Thermoplasmatota archaeon]